MCDGANIFMSGTWNMALLTWFTVPLLFIGMAAGARNAYVLAMDTIRQEKLKKDKAQQDEIDRKVEEYRKRQEKDSSEIKR